MSGPSVIVVGISSLLGHAVARELVARGARVGGTFFRGEERASELARSIAGGLVLRGLDLEHGEAIAPTLTSLADELGGADALVHCAVLPSAASGAPRYDRLDDVDPDGLAKMLAVNVASPIFCARAFAKLVSSRSPERRGETAARRNLVLVGSVDGAKSVPSTVPYATTKGAVVAMTRALAKELGPRGVLVTCVAPGLLEAGASSVVPDEVKREYLKHSAAKRFGSAAEVARTIAWLALSNTYVTGQTVVIDGGL